MNSQALRSGPGGGGGGAGYTAAPGSVHPPTSTCRPPASAQTSARLTAGDTIVMMATGAETSAITAPAAAAHDRTTWLTFVSSSLSDRESIPGADAPAYTHRVARAPGTATDTQPVLPPPSGYQ